MQRECFRTRRKGFEQLTAWLKNRQVDDSAHLHGGDRLVLNVCCAPEWRDQRGHSL